MTRKQLTVRLALLGCLCPVFWLVLLIVWVELSQSDAWRAELKRRREVVNEYPFLRKAKR